ncbi:hypothetical protein C8R47DRAFT_1072435 [Mycena vitilis]|nr:hypothetical protein C8R47DRAFT_1084430 [Mycena vitilis]KAJ6478864.1 hypothetical protein C8R47DRAFT_1074877 [Mycena vitilis]KAJ6486498.1 hypothetical protein C8R47DRAFT_1072435 [Mycena vitilis]
MVHSRLHDNAGFQRLQHGGETAGGAMRRRGSVSGQTGTLRSCGARHGSGWPGAEPDCANPRRLWPNVASKLAPTVHVSGQSMGRSSAAKPGSGAPSYRRRNPLDPDIDAEVDHSDLDHPPDPDPDLVVTPPEPEPEPARIERVRDRYIDYQSKINEWLDTCDPTTAPDYVPKPGERPYFQRGKKRWY